MPPFPPFFLKSFLPHANTNTHIRVNIRFKKEKNIYISTDLQETFNNLAARVHRIHE